MADLRTDYQDDVLDASENTARVYDLVDSNGKVVLAGVHLEDKTVYKTKGDDYGAADINTQNTKINQINASLSGKANSLDVTFGNQIIANISVSTGAEVGKYIREHIPLSKLQKGYVFNFIPAQSPQWFSGILYCDASTWATGATCWGFYMNRDNNILYKYNCVYGGTDAVTKLGGNMKVNYSSLEWESSGNSTHTVVNDGELFVTLYSPNNVNHATLLINNNPVFNGTSAEALSYGGIDHIPVSQGDVISISTNNAYTKCRLYNYKTT